MDKKEYIVVTIYKDHPTFVRRIDRYGNGGGRFSSFKVTKQVEEALSLPVKLTPENTI